MPIVRLRTDRIRALGWANRLRTAEALRLSLEAMRLEPPGAQSGGIGA